MTETTSHLDGEPGPQLEQLKTTLMLHVEQLFGGLHSGDPKRQVSFSEFSDWSDWIENLLEASSLEDFFAGMNQPQDWYSATLYQPIMNCYGATAGRPIEDFDKYLATIRTQGESEGSPSTPGEGVLTEIEDARKQLTSSLKVDEC